MKNCDFCRKQILIRAVSNILDLKSKEIQTQLHLSKSVVSRYMTGERGCIEIDIYLIEKAFGIKVKDFIVNE